MHTSWVGPHTCRRTCFSIIVEHIFRKACDITCLVKSGRPVWVCGDSLVHRHCMVRSLPQPTLDCPSGKPSFGHSFDLNSGKYFDLVLEFMYEMTHHTERYFWNTFGGYFFRTQKQWREPKFKKSGTRYRDGCSQTGLSSGVRLNLTKRRSRFWPPMRFSID